MSTTGARFPRPKLKQAADLVRRYNRITPGLLKHHRAMVEFRYFTRLPPEIRNEIYRLLFVTRSNLRICSPVPRRKRRPPQLDFTRLLLVNKQINAEAKTIFYSLNTFIIGNQDWAARHQANLHALKAFISRVPKVCISIIAKITIEMRAFRPVGWTTTPLVYRVSKEDVVQLQSLARCVLKHFTGVEFIELCSDISPQNSTRRYIIGDVSHVVKAIGRMLTLPHLKRMTFRGNFDPYIEQLIKDNEGKRNIITVVPRQQY